MRAVIKSVVPAVVLSLAGCASSPPVHFHTLSTPDAPGSGSRAQPDLRYQIGVVNVPERLNRVDIVVSGSPVPGQQGSRAGKGDGDLNARDGGRPDGVTGASAVRAPDTSVTVLDGDRWDASFADALRDALGTRLALASAASSTGERPARVRLSLQVYRFDGNQAGDVDVLVDWRLRRLDDDDEEADEALPAAQRVLSCRYQGHERVQAGNVDALVGAMQRQVASLADDIVASTRPWLRQGRTGCVQAAAGQP